jgi:DNA-directed RNA polymerase subunit RPC12/RpoP
LMAEADAICTWNGVSFDVPILHKEFLLAGLTPPAPSQQLDLLKTARRKFRLASNKLDFVAQSLGLGKKLKHKGMELWTGCMSGDEASWGIMKRYNKQDVVLLEKVYQRLVPWVERHPNLAEGLACPKCASKHAQRRGEMVTRTRKYARYQCTDCGAWYRSVKSEKGSAVEVVEV